MMQPDIKTDLAGTHQDEAIAGSQDSPDQQAANLTWPASISTARF